VKPLAEIVNQLELLKDCLENHCPGLIFYSSSLLLIYDDTSSPLVKLIDFANVRATDERVDSDLIKGVGRLIEIFKLISQ
jgi:hypothetical protein